MGQKIKVKVPGSKSMSHRHVICASLAQGESVLENVLESRDIAHTIEVLGASGAIIRRLGRGSYVVNGIGGAPQNRSSGPLECFMGESGTSFRILTGILAAGSGPFYIYGKAKLYERPMQELIRCLRELGADINCVGRNEGYPPLMLNAKGLTLPAGKELVVECDKSSQALSSLLLAAPIMRPEPANAAKDRIVSITLGGKAPVSMTYVALTLQCLDFFGVRSSLEVADDNGVWSSASWRDYDLRQAQAGKVRFLVRQSPYQASTLEVEGDWSAASYFLAAGAIGPREVSVDGLLPESLQGDRVVLELLQRMGARASVSDGLVSVAPATLTGIEADMGACPDLVPTLLAVAAHASGPSFFSNVGRLRHKESDRLAAMGSELAKVGCQLEVRGDSATVTPPAQGLRPPAAGTNFATSNDHRVAMSLCLLGLEASPELQGRFSPGFEVVLDDPSCVDKSFPAFWEAWEQVRHA